MSQNLTEKERTFLENACHVGSQGRMLDCSVEIALSLAFERLKDNPWDFQHGIFLLGSPSEM